MKTILKTIVCAFCLAALTAEVQAANVSYKLSLKQPGSAAVSYDLKPSGSQLTADQPLPVVITQKETQEGNLRRLTVTLTAQQRIYFNLGMALATDFATDDCDYYLPGFWYHKNLRSPESAPSFHTSKSWNVREDRLSAPLTGVYDGKSGRSVVVMRQLDQPADALTTHQEGEVILGGRTSLDYLEKNIISRSDYFSSTLDANCEDKEAAISAVTATYYLAMVSKKAQERSHYIALCQQAAYFALSWYYLWDVPFAQGQMLGDLGFKSRGWSNVSVENNHVDVFMFELAHIVNWLAAETGEQRFSLMHDLIASSLCQLLPTDERLCGIAIPGFNPEVVQHTHWDYGRNGKGFYNDIFAPAWAIASLWELYSPDRTVQFLQKSR